MSETSTFIGYGGRTIGREELALVPTPAATETHRPIPHHEIVRTLIETLGFRHIGVVHDEYAVSPDGMKMFGVLDLATEMEGCRFSIGVRNSHDKSMRRPSWANSGRPGSHARSSLRAVSARLTRTQGEPEKGWRSICDLTYAASLRCGIQWLVCDVFRRACKAYMVSSRACSSSMLSPAM